MGLGQHAEIEASYLTAEELRVAASLLYNAYHDDLFFQQAFGRQGYGQKLRAALREELAELWQHKQKLVGFYQTDVLVAVACIVDKDYPQGESRYWYWRLKMALGTGWSPTRHWMEREDELKRMLPGDDYWLLQLIAVHPQHQQQGIGGQVLSSLLQLLSESDSQGLAVFVSQPQHEKLFLRKGFRAMEKVALGDVTGQLMYFDAARGEGIAQTP
ncbi:GNAT family N-acetyltransferase [Ferrimonas sediminicola]|uniref:GNAT family N-acetyltransferase n=1 Tax=Ferrimonas sediminicola TaxID=2569538 RepID=A0A4U1BF48_9GAMM|nr:GNAT family N-acetyltransferase [Ferrimonas sediminicola]TKB49731.1 GNAT family N-acetyltransferase [Ferrimonas sediminicola]